MAGVSAGIISRNLNISGNTVYRDSLVGRRNFLITPLHIDLHICCLDWVRCLVRAILVTGKQNEDTVVGVYQLEMTLNSGIRIHSLKAHFIVEEYGCLYNTGLQWKEEEQVNDRGTATDVCCSSLEYNTFLHPIFL